MPETSIIITAQEKYSAAVKAMSRITKNFSKDQEALERTMLRLADKQNKLSREFDNAAQRARTLESAYAATGNEALRLQAESERLKLDNIQREFSLVTRGAQAAQRQIEGTRHALQTGWQESGGIASAIQTFANSGLGRMLGQVGHDTVTTLATSAFGEDTGTMVSSGLSSMASGAVSGAVLLGAFVTPVIGAAIGAVIGGLAGLANGAIKRFEKQEDYFKAYYNGILDGQTETRAKNIEAGSSIAAGRELDAVSFDRAFGDKNTAKGHVADLAAMSRKTPLSYEELVAMSKTMAAQGHGTEDIKSTLEAVSAAGTALELDVGAMNAVAAALGQIKSSDRVTAEQLKTLDDLGIDATGLLAEQKGLSVEETSKAVAQGEISGSDATALIQGAMQTKYNDSMTKQMDTFAGLTSTLEGWEQEMQNAYGEGYNETRKQGIEDDITAYEGDMGQERKKLNAMSGSLAAHRENLQEQYKREAVSAVLTGEDVTGSGIWNAEDIEELKKMQAAYRELDAAYQNAKGDAKDELGLKMALLAEQAEAMGQLAYENSDWAKLELTAEEENTKAIRSLTEKMKEGIMLRYQVDQEKTVGSLGASGTDYFTVNGGQRKVFSPNKSTTSIGGGIHTTSTGARYVKIGEEEYLIGSMAPKAIGLNRVPYDGYAALLHEGERVLTAREVRETDRNGGGGKSFVIHVTGNTFQTGQGGDMNAIAQELAGQILMELEKGVL